MKENIKITNYSTLYKSIGIFLALIAVCRIVSTYKIFNHTSDEPVDIVCGIEWLDRGTYLYGPDHPPLGRIAVGLLPFLSGIRLPETQSELLKKIELKEIKWLGNYRWEAGEEILHSNSRYFYNLALARLGNIPFLIILVLTTWIWSRKLFGDIAALFSILFITTIPSIIGHASLATTDIALTSLCFFGLYAFTCWFGVSNYRSSITFGLSWGLAVIAKFSALLFLPISAVSIAFWRILFAYRNKYRLNFQSLTEKIKPMLITLPIAAIIAFVVIWSSYHFSLDSLTTPEQRPHQRIDRILGEKGKVKDVAYLISESQIFPLKNFVSGIWMQKKHNDLGHPAYLLGEYSTHGWWYFFPIVFLIKTPLSFLLFVVIGSITLALKSIRERNWQLLVPFVSASGVMLSVIPANINLGIRYILILYPPLSIIAGYGVVYLLNYRKGHKVGQFLFAVLLIWYISSTSFAHPDYMAYFNEIAYRSPERFSIDSDLDWGQDLKRLSIELKRRNVKNLSLAYFGTADPKKFDLPPFKPLERHQSTTGWVAISLFELKDIFGPSPHDGYVWLEKHEPVATVGKSIKLYYIQ